MPEPNIPRTLLNTLKPHLPQMLATLRLLVLAESPSLEKGPADRCCGLLATEWRNRSVRVERLMQKHRGDHLRVTWSPGKRAKGQLLVLGHYDTVYETGALAKMPFRVSGGRAYGPGIFDMKAGIVQALFALDALRQTRLVPSNRLVFLWTSDEEIGSGSSRNLIEAEARRSDAVFVLEPALGPRGLLKTSRKGVGEAELVVQGRASHAGLAPEKGINAIHEMALQLARIKTWNNPGRGITVNAGIIEGGTRVNVIPDRARSVLDLRASRIADMRQLEHRLCGLCPILQGARISVHGGFNRPPMERRVSAQLYAKAKALATQMGLSLGECAAGGASDGNLTAALGIPTLDGLGAVGDGAHATHEHIIVRALPERAALLAALLATV